MDQQRMADILTETYQRIRQRLKVGAGKLLADAEAAEDEAAKQAEIAAARAGYNATTGAYSGGYGKNQEMNDSEREMVGNIMSERDNALMETIQSAEDGID